MIDVIFILIAIVALVTVMAVLLREDIGMFLLTKVFPSSGRKPQKGDLVDIFVNGEFNRRATVTACCQSYLSLYESVRCPIDHRGAFYAIGEDINGNEIAYMADRRHYRLVKHAERVRKIFGVGEDFDFLPPRTMRGL